MKTRKSLSANNSKLNSQNLARYEVCKSLKQVGWKKAIVGLLSLVLLSLFWQQIEQHKISDNKNVSYFPPSLVMTGGDPYIRALMRTISASEAQDSAPYNLLYGGQYFSNLSRHPNQCIAIVSGPYQGQCSTAAGRYQFLTSTWLEKAQKYHRKHSRLLNGNSYSFEPQLQDEVVYAWLNDHHAWGVDIADLLEQGKLAQVLQLLSGTWTSLGYGTENNSITPLLSQIYRKVLIEELAQANSSSPPQLYTARFLK